MIDIWFYKSPIGQLTIASEDDYLVGVWFDGQKYDRAILKNKDYQIHYNEVIGQTIQWLDLYFGGEILDFIPKLRIEGSLFHRTVSEIMQTIPYGETMTYGAIAKEAAKRLGKEKMSAQAVGGAVGHNPISIIVPCHRVLGSKGNLTGYAGGLNRKKWLLAQEGIHFKEK